MNKPKPKYQIGDVIYGWKIKRVSYYKPWQTFVYNLSKGDNRLGCDEKFIDNSLATKH